jgi:hypothetical protein
VRLLLLIFLIWLITVWWSNAGAGGPSIRPALVSTETK